MFLVTSQVLGHICCLKTITIFHLLLQVRFQHEDYPTHTEQASRQVLLISDIEIRDKLKSSRMNKFLYQYYSDDLPKQTYANMVCTDNSTFLLVF